MEARNSGSSEAVPGMVGAGGAISGVSKDDPESLVSKVSLTGSSGVACPGCSWRYDIRRDQTSNC
ncbi:hypothetical protein OROHE_016910 [Orobanche hederae]